MKRYCLTLLAFVMAVLVWGQSDATVTSTMDPLRLLMPRPAKVTPLDGCYTGDVNQIEVVRVSEAAVGTFDYPVEGFENEGYRLTVTPDAIRITAATRTGEIRARQTLAQLAHASSQNDSWQSAPTDCRIPCCDITDYPAFKIRGFMHDTGRSFIGFEELKHEIDLLARFKVNLFHWHLTDNQGFRFESRRYPALNHVIDNRDGKGYGLRFAGCYYTQAQCRELEAYAAERGMIVIPEIDMPGHSESFTRAMGFTMESKEGRAVLKDILSELCEAFPLAPYIHIGADESGATPEYVREMTDCVHSLGRKAVCWNTYAAHALVEPERMGIDLVTNWATSGRLVRGIPNVDMRYFYTNHFDTYADLAGAYRSTILEAERGNPDIGGVSIGIWNDRRLSDSEDQTVQDRLIVAQNHLYATVLAMTERAWMGGEGHDYIERCRAYLPSEGPEYEEYCDWERRFLYYKDTWLAAEPIPYVRSTDVRWRLTLSDGRSLTATGAGQWLNHIWAGIVGGVLGQEAQPVGQTCTAETYVYSETEQTVGAQIQFYDYSRSDYDTAPEDGQWDLMGSRVWVNDNEIRPTWHWDNAGVALGRGDLEVPLGNLNYSTRPPVPIQLHVGWNHVRLHLPYNPPSRDDKTALHPCRPNKWQFTFVLTTPDGRHAAEGVRYAVFPDDLAN